MQVFRVEQTYTKNQIYELLNVPIERRKGSWDTGYREYNGDCFIFANIGIPGRTGHQYSNYWDGDLLYWEAKTGTRVEMPSVQKLLSTSLANKLHIFSRTNDTYPFTYEGIGHVEAYFDRSPVKFIWRFNEEESSISAVTRPPILITENHLPLWEGGAARVYVNKYERNRGARRECVAHYGAICSVCRFNFQERYGAIGSGFIHVHHLLPLASVTERYQVDPLQDLIPVCPNCHCMLHARNPAYTIEELKSLMKRNIKV